ncbi:hypothetical protein MRX96_034447 [Rhipicephalus microplus]
MFPTSVVAKRYGCARTKTSAIVGEMANHTQERKWLKRSPELLNLDYHSREAQKSDEDFIIGQETRTVVDKLKPSEQQEFFEAVRHYFVTVCDYMRH